MGWCQRRVHGDLPKIYETFGSEIPMKLSPFVFEEQGVIKNVAGINCFDEPSPCVLEQYSQCVIQLTNDQTKYVPWLTCMDTKGETSKNVKTCAEAQGISNEAVSKCQKEDGSA